MKKILSLLVILAVLMSLCTTVMATKPEQSLDEVFEAETSSLDVFYELDGHYMATKVMQTLYTWEEMEQNNYEPKTVAAAEVEAVLYKFFAPTEAQLQSFRENLQYDAAAGTYQLTPWGGFGGFLPEREYLGYQKLGDVYKIYWRAVDYGYLGTVLPDDVEEYEYAESLGWPETITYGGIEYTSGPDGYYCINGKLNHGKVYTVEYNDGVVRILSAATFDEQSFPVLHKIPVDSGIALDVKDSFSAGTVIQVETVLPEETKQAVEQAVSTVAQKYYAFDITAKLEGEPVQPEKPLFVTVAIPEGFSTNITAYYVTEGSEVTLEPLETQVNAQDRMVTIQLEHFSTYLLADNETKPEPTQPTQPSEPTQPEQQGTTGVQSGTQPQTNPTGSQNPSEPGNVGTWIAVAAIAAAAVLLIIGFLLYRKGSRK